MLYAGLDLSRKRLEVHLLREDGSTALVTLSRPTRPPCEPLFVGSAARVSRFGPRSNR